jgi:hypothetical protein
MKRNGKILAASLAIAGGLVLGVGMSSTPASADPYCGPGYHYVGGYCYPNVQAYYPPAYYAPPPVYYGPSVGIGFGFGGGGWHGGHGGGGWHR